MNPESPSHIRTSMPETTVSPNPTTAAPSKRLPVAARILSPTSPVFIGSNDDQVERAQARAARATAIRRKSLAAAANFPSRDPDSDPCLTKDQILDLFHNCIKLAAENKINQKNTWELKLIDHLTDFIRTEEESDVETNFQIASCTLEAGVKIYSLRVDSVHSEAYKVLARMNRVGQEAEEDSTLDSVNAEDGHEESKKGIDKKLSPLSTLESSFEALNVKKFDVAFAVDPLYRHTSAQFDEGGAKGLLMNNLGVYGGCRVLFDSLEVPGKCIASQSEQDISDTIDLSFLRDCIEEMLLNMRMKDEISPTLRVIVNQFDENNRRPSDFEFSGQKSAEEFGVDIDCSIAAERGEYENFPSWCNDHDNQTFVAEQGSNDAEPSFSSYPQEKEPFPSQDSDMDGNFENVDEYIFLSLGLRSKKNAWAGPDHWKYGKAKESVARCTSEDDSTLETRQPRAKRQDEDDLEFTSCLETKFPDIFCPPKNSKSLLLPENRPPCVTKLPEDCHYEPQDLVKLFLLPNVKCLGRRARKLSGDVSEEQGNDYESFPSWDNGGVGDGEYDGDTHSDIDDPSTLISQPRRVNKIEVDYDKTSKQVDVQALKIALWDHIQESIQLHVPVKSFSMDILKQGAGIWAPEVISNLDIMLDNMEAKLSESASPSYIFPLQQFLFTFLCKVLAGADTSHDPKIAESGFAMLNRWLAVQLLPTVSIGILQPLEEIFLHSFAYPFFLVSGDYNNIYNFVKQQGKEVIKRGVTEFGLSEEEAIHNLLFVLGFNAFGGFSVFLPSLINAIASDSTGLQEKLKKEVREKGGSTLGFSSVKEMDLVQSVVYETLRLNPPVPLQYARARKDFRLSSNDSAFQVKKGELLCGYQKLVMRDPAVFDEPDSFKPDRFTSEKGAQLLNYLYWSNGPQTGTPSVSNKQCAGKDIVTLTASLIVAHLFRRYDSIKGDASSITALQKAK